jgi:hypothetical protein
MSLSAGHPAANDRPGVVRVSIGAKCRLGCAELSRDLPQTSWAQKSTLEVSLHSTLGLMSKLSTCRVILKQQDAPE